MLAKTWKLHKADLTLRLLFVIIFLFDAYIFIIAMLLGTTKFKDFLLGADPCWMTDAAILNESEIDDDDLFTLNDYLLGELPSILL